MTFFLLRSCRAIFVTLGVLCLFVSVPRAQAEFRQPAGSRIAIDISPDLKPSERFSGFVDKSAGVSFVIIELPRAAYDEVKKLPEQKDALAQQGLSEAIVADLPERKGEFVYFTGTQTVEGQTVNKMILVFRENAVTGMIIVNLPEKAITGGTYTREQIEKILATATVKDEPGKAAELFRFGYLGPFKDAFGLLGSSKGYNISGTTPASGENIIAKEPTLVVSSSIDERQIFNLEGSAQRSFQNLGGLKNKTVERESKVTISGLNGYQVVGEATDAEAGARIAVNLVLLQGKPGGYYAIVGTTPSADKDKYMAEIEKVIQSFEPVKPEQ